MRTKFMVIGHWRGVAFAATLLFANALIGSAAGAQKDAVKNAAPKDSRRTEAKTAGVDFARDVQPLLKAHCYQCHSGKQTLGGLALDTRALTLKGGVSGTALVPGSAAKSLLLLRILGQGGKPRMPMGFAPLSEPQTATLRAWIAQGAKWPEGASVKKHWAYIPPKRPALPTVKNPAWCKNPIDRFVLARLEKEGLKPSPEADKITLLRRVTLDLTGLLPTPQEVTAFLADNSTDAYTKVVDRLLASPHYGERMALPWLDAARYADSNGFQQDGDTYQYLWRDWVVRALNANMPFDRFTIEQLAGDLLPSPTLDQKIATGFNRCHLLNGEGGAIPEEQRNVILFDRVDVTATTWLGATMACAQCHDHKYDPISQKDYYAFMAFFNNVPESGTPPFGGQYRIAEPAITAGSAEELAKLTAFEDQIAQAKARVADFERGHSTELQTAQTAWETDALKSIGTAPQLGTWQAVGPFPAAGFDAAYDMAFAPETAALKAQENLLDLAQTFASGNQKWTAHSEWADGKVYQLDGENSAIYLYRTLNADRAMPLTLSFGSDDAIKVWLNGHPVLANKTTRAAAPDQEKATVQLRAGVNTLLVKIVNGGGIGGFYFKVMANRLPDPILAALKTPAPQRAEPVALLLRDYFLANNAPPSYRTVTEQVRALEKQRDEYRTALPRVMIMSDAQPRKTHILQRGNYEMPGDEVQACTPGSFAPMPPGTPNNRLGLAQWLMSADNPLVSRVYVNRAWQLFFGNGLVKTAENLGTQAEPPTHPALLDWLAVEFMGEEKGERRKEKESSSLAQSSSLASAYSSGWNVKRLHKLIVMSATYRQSSRVTPALRLRDPENKLLARGARFRLPSPILRDVALASSGLLDPRIGGKPVYPYQPTGIWDGLSITKERDFTYPQSKGADLYRRSLYTFWRRTVAPANMFDASVRTTCKVRLSTTSTPLHALTTLNDTTWVEAGRVLAEHILKEAGASPDARLSEAFRRVCARRPTLDELRVLKRSLNRALAAYRTDPEAAKAYISVGDSPHDMTLDAPELAAYAAVCLAVYNLDEALTRE